MKIGDVLTESERLQKIINPNLRHDFLMLFDVQDGNPNGDPDAGNMPRVDPETMQGLVTDVCIKRKVRDFVDLSLGDKESYKIYIQNKGIALNDLHQRAYTALGLEQTGTKQNRDDVSKARKWMCSNFYDIRMFGAVMSTGVNCGQVRGPVQLTFGRSIDPIVPLDVSITRVAITKSEDAKATESGDGKESEGTTKVTEMGRKAVLPYGLYLSRGFFSPKFAQDTGVSSDDLELFWDALLSMWDIDRSAARGFMSLRGLYIFTHENPLGNAPTHRLFDRLSVKRKDGVETARSFFDYDVYVNKDDLPEGITLTEIKP